MDKRLLKRIKELSREKNIPESIIQKAFESQFRMMRETMDIIDVLNMTEEEFKKNKINFNWKYLGRLQTRYDYVQSLKQRWERIQKEKK